MDHLGALRKIQPIQTDSEFTIEPYRSWQFGCIDHHYRQFRKSSVWTRARSRIDSLELLLTVAKWLFQDLRCGRMNFWDFCGWMDWWKIEVFGEVLGLILAFCVFYYYRINIHAWRTVLRVRDIEIDRWELSWWEWHTGSDRTPCMTIMLLVVRLLCPSEVIWNNYQNMDTFVLIVITILVMEAPQYLSSISVSCHCLCWVPVLLRGAKSELLDKPGSLNCWLDKITHQNDAFNHLNAFFLLSHTTVHSLFIGWHFLLSLGGFVCGC